MTSCHELKVLNVMNNSRLFMTLTTSGWEFRALDAMNSSGLWMT